MDYKEQFPPEILPMSLLQIVTFNTDYSCSTKTWHAPEELVDTIARKLGEPDSEALIDAEHIQSGLDTASPGMTMLYRELPDVT